MEGGSTGVLNGTNHFTCVMNGTVVKNHHTVGVYNL